MPSSAEVAPSLTLKAVKVPFNFRICKTLIAAKLAGVAVQLVPVAMGVDNETDEWQRRGSPTYRLPILEVNDGAFPGGHDVSGSGLPTCLFESNAILRFVAKIGKKQAAPGSINLYGNSLTEEAAIDGWVDFCASELDADVVKAGRMARGVMPKDDAVLAAAAKNVLSVLQGVETWLQIRTFFVGERLSIADIAFAIHLQAFLTYNDATVVRDIFQKCPQVIRLYRTVFSIPEVAATYVQLGDQEGGLFSTPVKMPAAVVAPKPVVAAAAAPAAKPSAADDEEDDEADAAKEVKKANPLDSLPPSPFVIDNFKREYSNKDTRKEVLPWLWSNFDAQGWTMWFCRYKYPQDLSSQVFMTANFVRGWFQRMEGNRKYAFGSALILGTPAAQEVQAFWIFRGQKGAGLPACVTDVEDTELFEWTEVTDAAPSEAVKEKIGDFLAWDGATFAALPVLEGKAFK